MLEFGNRLQRRDKASPKAKNKYGAFNKKETDRQRERERERESQQSVYV